ncbi:hypothetical protein D0T53_03345 [Dysgonomonas sp. 216]|uniref:hypothetical protein n=1 Tax=Dysgonomonas sp. 216 TaxID=2302934 RepID=UPI0013D3FA64|nr:hypothetical protein [Dysgonomonas sp. 216]NDW17952.1 hypothetical protein [Dysgonomonas sp. 216]
MKTKVTFLLLVLFFISASFVEAANRQRIITKKQNHSCNIRCNFAHIPNLTPKQRNKIDKICYNRDKKVKLLEHQKRQLKYELVRLERRPYHGSCKKVERVKTNIHKKNIEIARVTRDAELKVYSLLSRGQRIIYT